MGKKKMDGNGFRLLFWPSVSRGGMKNRAEMKTNNAVPFMTHTP